MASYLLSIGFVEAKSDTSLFIYQRGSDTAYLLLYVDGIILTACSMSMILFSQPRCQSFLGGSSQLFSESSP